MENVKNNQMTVLIADDEVEVRNVIGRYLTKKGYFPIMASNGREALGKSRIQKPDIVLLDINMPIVDGFRVCKELREDASTRFMPILMLTGGQSIEDKVMGLNIGADDYLTKPFELAELQARIDVLLRRNRNMISVNPLTRLPGSPSIQDEVESRICSGQKFGVAYIDIDNFKAYNDVYGYSQGDLVIVWTAKLIQDSINQPADKSSRIPDYFLGHIGGDDFILVSDADSIKNSCESVASRFDGNRNMWYNLWDKLQGNVQVKDRQGTMRIFPLMTLSIAVSTNEKREISHYGEIARIISELKKYAKSRVHKVASSVVIDRRIS